VLAYRGLGFSFEEGLLELEDCLEVQDHQRGILNQHRGNHRRTREEMRRRKKDKGDTILLRGF